MDHLDAFAPPTARPTPRPTCGTVPVVDPVPGPGQGSGPAPAPSRDRSHRGRVPAVVSLGSGLAAVVAAALGNVLPVPVLPLLLVAVLAAAALAAGVVALVRSRAADVVLLGAGGAVSAAVAGAVAAASLVLPLAPPDLGEAFTAAAQEQEATDGLPADLLAAFAASAEPLGTTAVLEGEDVAVVAVRTDPADVAARLEDLDWLREDAADLGEVVLVELEAPVDGGGWASVVDDGDVSVVTSGGLLHSSWSPDRSASYEVDTLVEPDAEGLPRGLVVLAVPMPHVDAEDALVVVTSPSWTDVATWETT